MAREQEGGAIGRPAKPVLEQRGGVWHYRFTVKGHRVRGTTGERDRGRAESYLAARWYEEHQRARVPVAAGLGVGLDLRQLAGMWLAQLERHADERNPQFVKRHRLDVRYLLGVFRLPGDATDATWQTGMRKLHEEGLSWASLRHATVTLRGLLRFGASIGAIGAEPALRPPPNRLITKEAAPRRALSDTERDRVLKALRRISPRAARAWTAMAYSGLRRGELARLTLRDVDLRAGVIHVLGKSGHRESVALHPEARKAILAEASGKARGAPVFGRFDIRKAWRKALARSRVDAHGLTAHHSARHTFGTLVAQESRGDVPAVQAALRHRSLAMVQKYVHANAARARAAIRRL